MISYLVVSSKFTLQNKLAQSPDNAGLNTDREAFLVVVQWGCIFGPLGPYLMPRNSIFEYVPRHGDICVLCLCIGILRNVLSKF